MRWRDTGRTMFGHRMKLMEEEAVFDPYLSFRFAYHNDCPLTARGARKKIRLRCFYPLDVCAKFAQFLIEMLVAAVDMIDTTDLGYSVGFQACKHQRGRSA